MIRARHLLVLCLLSSASAVCAQEEHRPRVYAASSLTDVLAELFDRFERETGRAKPRLTLASSSRLARQVEDGAPVDLVITADEAWMDVLVEGGHVLRGSREVLLTNRLVVVVPKGTQLKLTSPKDLTALRRIAVAGQAVPAGRRAREALTHHRLLGVLEPRFVRSTSVRAALALVARGEVDAGIVYATDARATDKVEVTFRFDPSAHTPIRYPIALTPRAQTSKHARALYEFLRSETARPVFEQAGFGTPRGAGTQLGSGVQAPTQILAASSLTDVLSRLADGFARETGKQRPRTAFASSSRIAHQVEEGAPAELVITADEAWMDTLEESGLLLAGSRGVLLVNRLVFAVPRGASWVPKGPKDLRSDALKLLAVAGKPVPAGRRAREALTHHGLHAALEPKFVNCPNVRAALALVSRGEVDGAIVYATDAAATDKVEVAFPFERKAHTPIRYPAALTQRARDNPDARAFFDYLRGDAAKEAFRQAGFRIPGSRRGMGQPTNSGDSIPRAQPVPPGDPDWFQPLVLSAWVATLSLLLSLAPAILLGWLLARREFFGKALVSTFLLVPLVLPPVVTGYVLLAIFGRHGPFAALGVEIAFSRWGAVVAAAVVGFPLLIIMTRAAIESVDPRYEQLAETLGLHPFAAFLKVTLPMSLPGVLSGCVLAFTRALGEFGATAILASDVPGETRTLALAVFALYEEPGGEDAARMLVWVSLGLCLVALVGYERLTAAQQRRIAERGK